MEEGWAGNVPRIGIHVGNYVVGQLNLTVRHTVCVPPNILCKILALLVLLTGRYTQSAYHLLKYIKVARNCHGHFPNYQKVTQNHKKVQSLYIQYHYITGFV